jgi:hypothetical protein
MTRKPGSHVRIREDGIIEYDVRHVKLPFPLGKDPEIERMRPKVKRHRPRKPLPPELEQYRLYTDDELGEWPPVD